MRIRLRIRTRTRTLLAVAGLLVAAGSARAAESVEKVETVLARQTQELLDAIGSGSAAVWEKYLDDGAIYVDESGNVTPKKQMVADIRPLPEGVSGKIRVTGFQAHVFGDVTVTTYVSDENEDYHGHKLHCQYRSTDTWRKTPGGWKLIAGQILALRTDPPPIVLSAALRKEYCGVYSLTPTMHYTIQCEGDGLVGVREGRKPEKLVAEAPDVLFVPGQPRYRYVFLRDKDGKLTGFAQRREAWDIVWTRETAPPKS